MSLDFEALGEQYEEGQDQVQRIIHRNKPHIKGRNISTENLKKDIQENAEKSIRKYINNVFETLDEPIKNEKLNAYRLWVQESLKDSYPFFDEEDLTRKEGTGWVKITHTPTLYGAIGSGEETRDLNDRAAQIEVFNLIYNHFNQWKETSEEFRKSFSLLPPAPVEG